MKMSRRNTVVSCPCEKQAICLGKRETAVNAVLRNRICTANEIRALIRINQGKSAMRKGLEFLSSEKCDKVTVLKDRNGRQMQFRNHGKLYFRKDVLAEELNAKILALLTTLQWEILRKLEKYHRTIYYFSLYELRKIVPYPGAQVNYAVNRLCNLGLASLIKARKFKFITTPQMVPILRTNLMAATIEEKTEYLAAKRLHELIMNIYPLGLITKFKKVLRPHTRRVLATTGGMTFDIFYQFDKPVENKRFLAIDVYTRLPVNGYVVYSLINKISRARTRSGGLRDTTYGMIVYKNATLNAINIANENKIRFINLLNFKADYKQLRMEAIEELKIPEARTIRRSSTEETKNQVTKTTGS